MNARYIWEPFCNNKLVWAFSIRASEVHGRKVLQAERIPLSFDVPKSHTNIVETELGLVGENVRVTKPIVIGSDTNEPIIMLPDEKVKLRDKRLHDLYFNARYHETSQSHLDEFESFWNDGVRFLFKFENTHDQENELCRLETVHRILVGDRYDYLGIDSWIFLRVNHRRVMQLKYPRYFNSPIKQPKTNFFNMVNTAAKLAKA